MSEINVLKGFKVDELMVKIYRNRDELGLAAASAVAVAMKKLLEKQPEIRMVFAAAPSQNDFLEGLSGLAELDWQRVTAFHMDEYLGLPSGSHQSFGFYLKTHIFDRVPFKDVHYLHPEASEQEEECDRYSDLLQEAPIDVVCMGIGENGHVAFNDPPVADFNDPKVVKVVELDSACRLQQVHDGCFAKIDEVPRQAMTLTVPALMSGKQLFIMVPGSTKSGAVTTTLQGPIHNQCPASVLRKHPAAILFLDFESGRNFL